MQPVENAFTTENNVLTPEEVATILRCSVTKVRRLFKKGDLQGFRVGDLLRIYATSLPAFMRANANTKKPEPLKARVAFPKKSAPVKLAAVSGLKYL